MGKTFKRFEKSGKKRGDELKAFKRFEKQVMGSQKRKDEQRLNQREI